jgi:tetratricopeptide (TPR) repeat protein
MARLSEIFAAAERHVAGGHHDDARNLLEAVLRKLPEHPETLLRLSYLESLAGHYRAARGYALRAAATHPRDAAVSQDLLRRLRTFNEMAAIRGYLDGLPPLREVGIPVLLTIAAQLSYLNLQEDALRLLDEAARGDPDYPPTLVSRGQVLTYLGRFDEAERDLLRCTARAPELASGWWALSRLRRQTRESNHVDALRARLAQPPRHPDDPVLLAYALHKELDDLGEHDDAAEALARACRAKRALLRYSRDDNRALFDRLLALPAPPAGAVAPSASGAPAPVFIVGMHRSGTTLLEQLLDGHPQVRGLGELYDFTGAMRLATDHHCRGVVDATIVERARGLDFAAVGRSYLDGVAWRLDGQAFFTDKLPSNFLNLGFICRALAQARILHMVRDPVETCFSNLRELFSDANPYSYDQLELADYHHQYRRLMAHWHQAWPGRILDVDYARLTREPEAVVREVAAFCGLPFDPAMLAHRERGRGVATASAVQVRGEVVARERPKWEPYRDYLQPLIGALAD